MNVETDRKSEKKKKTNYNEQRKMLQGIKQQHVFISRYYLAISHSYKH